MVGDESGELILLSLCFCEVYDDDDVSHVQSFLRLFTHRYVFFPQRAQYQNVQQGKKSWLTEKRVALLDEIGFDWNPIIGKSTPDETSKKKK